MNRIYHMLRLRHFNTQVWQSRFVTLGASLITGLVIVGFVRLTEVVTVWFLAITHFSPWIPVIMMPFAGMGIVWLTRRWFDGSGGSGIPQVVAALNPETQTEKDRSLYVSLKIALGKIILGASVFLAGFSSGREGPSVQIGASIMNAFQRFMPKSSQISSQYMILAGGAAGLAAAFNAPLAGIFFAIEELNKRFEEKTNGILISAIVLSGLVAISLNGNYPYFGKLHIQSVDYRVLFPVISCAFICGIAGGLFSRILAYSPQSRRGWAVRLLHSRPILWAGFCGLMVGLLGLISEGHAFGSSYGYTHSVLIGQTTMPWYFASAKFAATLFSYLSGIPGGIFAPCLAVGAGLGANVQAFFGHEIGQSAVYALCMAGFLAAVTQAPLTSFVIVMEMIDGHQMIISLMAVALISSLISRMFGDPLYTVLSQAQLKRRSSLNMTV